MTDFQKNLEGAGTLLVYFAASALGAVLLGCSGIAIALIGRACGL